MKLKCCVAILTALCCSALEASAYDFSLQLSGPQTATPGYPIFLQVDASIVEGTRNNIKYDVDVPDGVMWKFPNLDSRYGGELNDHLPRTTLLRLDVPEEFPAGPFEAVVSAVSGGIFRSGSYTIYVDPISAGSSTLDEESLIWRNRARIRDRRRPVRSSANIGLWKYQMKEFGEYACNEETINQRGTWEGSVWYYDGIRVFYQLEDYLSDAKWAQCASYVKSIYLSYVLKNGGSIPGWRVFPHGLYEDFLRTNDTRSRDAILQLRQKGLYVGSGGAIPPVRARETAYVLHLYRYAARFGVANPLLERTVAFALGHLDQWFPRRPGAVFAGTKGPEPHHYQPFMVGLVMESLIAYYEETKDPRIPPAIERAINGLWEEAWIDEDESFFYHSQTSNTKGAPDLNLLIAPAFAWAYKETGNNTYLSRGDSVFNGGVKGAWLHGGKQFSQSYRWSFDYVKWVAAGSR